MENIETSASIAVSLAQNFLFEWLSVRKKNHTNTLPPQVAATYVWNPPHTGSLKCNLDVALFIDQNKFGIGFCMRDDQGTFIKARTELYPGTPTAHEAEVFTLHHTIL